MRNRQALRISVAVAVSLGVHFAAAMVAGPSQPPVLVEGGATAEIAMLGSNFENLLQGSDRLTPEDPAPVKPVRPEPMQTRPVQVEPVKAEPVQQARAVETKTVSTARPVETAKAIQATVTPVAYQVETASVAPRPLTGTVPVAREVPAETETAKPVDPLPAARSIETPEPARPTEPAETAEAPQETAPAKPVEVAALTPSHAVETVRAEPEAAAIPVPVARPPLPEDARNLARAREAAKKKTEQKQVANLPRGNADRNARAGQADGNAQSKSKAGGGESSGKSNKAGNAQAANYPGKVYSKIRRTRQKRAGGSGVARVRFSIAANGALAGVSITASSGSASVDSAAVDHIRRSAPFPPPPSGAQRQFVIPVEVRR